VLSLKAHFPDHARVENSVCDILVVGLEALLEHLGKIVKDHL